jgi:hypothetical protein
MKPSRTRSWATLKRGVGAVEAKERPGRMLIPAEVNRLAPRNFRREKDADILNFGLGYHRLKLL